MDKLFDRLQMLEDRYEELGELLSDPDVIADTQRFTKLSKEMADLRETVEKYNQGSSATAVNSFSPSLSRPCVGIFFLLKTTLNKYQV